MQTRTRPGSASLLDSSTNPQTGVTATLMPFSISADLGILAPSIESLAVNEGTDELAVNGLLGEVPGHVLMGDDDLTIKSWDEISAICALPRTGADSTGLVKVIVNGGAQFSNVVPFTSWHGTATYTLEEVGSLKMVMTFDLTFRGDIHDPREQPGEHPAERGLAFEHALVSSGTYDFSGRFDDPVNRFSEDWSGSGTMSGAVSLPQSFVSAVGTIGGGKWQMEVLAVAAQGNHVHTVQRDPQGNVIDERNFDQDGFGVPNLTPPGPAFQSAINGGFNIAAGSSQAQVDSQIDPSQKALVTVEWSAFTPQFAPTSTTTE
jgi:hypothetical protein